MLFRSHPTKDRPLSVEEYRRLQEFPDEWKICGPIKEQYRQVGNAVPIKLGEAIARTIIADMKGKKLPQFRGYPYSRYKKTSDRAWAAAMDLTIAKERAAQASREAEQLTLTGEEHKNGKTIQGIDRE